MKNELFVLLLFTLFTTVSCEKEITPTVENCRSAFNHQRNIY
jgi:hypothetical protein